MFKTQSYRQTARALLVPLATTLAALGLSAQTFSDDFDDGNDDGWIRYDLTAALNANGIPGNWANYNFPDDGAGGKAYQIHALPYPAAAQALSFPRVVVYRPEVYSQFKMGVDVLEWDASAVNSLGLLLRMSNVGLGTTAGYMINLNPPNRDLDITLIAGEASAAILQTVDADLKPEEGPYRFESICSTFGGFVGHIYQLSDPRAPIVSVAAADLTYDSGMAGLIALDFNEPAENWTGAKVTYDNYSAEALPEGLPPEVVFLQPGHLSVAESVPATTRVSIFEIDPLVNVDADSVRLEVDGVAIPNSELDISWDVYLNRGQTTLQGRTVTYTPSVVPARLAGVHTNKISFQDAVGNSVTKEWVYTYPVLPVENALPPGSGEKPGFAVRLVQSEQETENSLERAEQQLAHPPEIPISLETNSTISVINYTQQAVPNDTPDGYFVDEATFPGIDPNGHTDDMAMELLFYLDMPAGTHHFGVKSDDGFQLRSGANPTDPDAMVLGEKKSGTYDGTFDVYVEQAGVYPCRMVWFERGGGAHVELFTEDPDKGTRILINDPESPIKAFQSVAGPALVLESAATLPGAFAEETGAAIDTDTKRIIVNVNGDTRYYRLRAASPYRITHIEVEGTNVLMSYEAAE